MEIKKTESRGFLWAKAQYIEPNLDEPIHHTCEYDYEMNYSDQIIVVIKCSLII